MNSIEFLQDRKHLLLVYRPSDGVDWVNRKLATEDFIVLRRTFKLTQDDVYEDFSDESLWDEMLDRDLIYFSIAKKKNKYFKFNTRVLDISFDLYIYEGINLTFRSFTAEKNVSVFSKMDEIGVGNIYIGGGKEGAIPEEIFYELIKKFPNTYELRRYVQARLSAILRDYIDIEEDYEEKYQKYMNKKISRQGVNMVDSFREYEAYKFNAVLAKIEDMLHGETEYNEHQWQKEILQIVLLLFPKYIHVFEEVRVRDTYNNKNRKLDLMLVDACGNVDIVEIKRPFEQCIVSKSTYRDNYVPLKELSGTIMQIEKYLFYLNKWGKKGEDELTSRYRDQLPAGLEIKVTNPSGLVIMGRLEGLTLEQKQDFEVVKRKYKNVIDIITYDDLLIRLRFMVEQLKKGPVTG